jgi:hypothetical protein
MEGHNNEAGDARKQRPRGSAKETLKTKYIAEIAQRPNNARARGDAAGAARSLHGRSPADDFGGLVGAPANKQMKNW